MISGLEHVVEYFMEGHVCEVHAYGLLGKGKKEVIEPGLLGDVVQEVGEGDLPCLDGEVGFASPLLYFYG